MYLSYKRKKNSQKDLKKLSTKRVDIVKNEC